MIQIKRAYDPAEKSDGKRILVDRLWPRGVTKERAALDRWAKDLAPSNELRQWFHHDASNWEEFENRYRAELADKKEDLRELAKEAKHSMLTLVYGAKDPERNQAVVLKELIENS